jgi:sugar O-acyltransferase (sialic acid O-acetyltransferase NeuD family)
MKIHSSQDIVILGAGGFGKEVLETLLLLKEFNVLGFIDENKKPNSFVNRFRVLGGIDWLRKRHTQQLVPIAVAIAVGDPFKRYDLVKRLNTIKNIWFPTIIHPSNYIAKSAKIGDGVIIQQHCNISPNISIGEFTHINCFCIVGHDDIIGDFNTLSPSTNIMGNVKTGDKVFFGVNASIDRGISIEGNTKIGGCAFVMNNVPKNTFYVGIPAKLKRNL